MSRYIDKSVVIIGFNRFDYIKIQMDFIINNEYKFKSLDLVFDGIREGNQNDKYAQGKIDAYLQLCKSKIEFEWRVRESNLGCKRNIQKTLKETFEKVEDAIFLEDDCIPVIGFFEFMEYSLNMYRYDQDIVHISGSNLLKKINANDIYKSIFPNFWGWAGWANKSSQYIVSELYLSEINCALKKSINFSKLPRAHKLYWKLIYKNSLQSNTVWDFEYAMNMMIDSKFSIYPGVNLINNIGFRTDSTHMKFDKAPNYVTKNLAQNSKLNDRWNLRDEKRTLISYRTIVLYEYSLIRLIRLIFGSCLRYVIY
jgi:hypothetical protein